MEVWKKKKMGTDVSQSLTLETGEACSFDLSKGRDELNLIELPLTLSESARRQLSKNGTRSYQFQTPPVWDHDVQQHVVRTVDVIPSADLGFPGTFDNRVMLACISLAKWKTDFQERSVPFSVAELIDILRLSKNGGSYTRVRQSMERWQSTNYRISYPWYGKNGKKRKAIKRFSLFDNIDWEAKDDENDSRFVLNDVLFQSLSSGYVRGIDLEQYNQFESHFAAEAFRYLGKVFYQNPVQIIPLEKFAFHVSAGDYSDNGQLKRKLKPALKELEEQGIIRPLPEKERFEKVRRGQWNIRLEQPSKKKQKLSTKEKQTELFEIPVIQELLDRGVSEEVARHLSESEDENHITHVIEWVDWLLEKEPAKIESLAGYLVKAITGHWTAPVGFESKTAQLAKEKAKKEWNQKKRRQEDQRQKEAEAAREQQAEASAEKWQAVCDHLDALSDADRKQVIDEAVATDGLRMAAKYRDQIETGEVYRLAYQAALTSYILPRLS